MEISTTFEVTWRGINMFQMPLSFVMGLFNSLLSNHYSLCWCMWNCNKWVHLPHHQIRIEWLQRLLQNHVTWHVNVYLMLHKSLHLFPLYLEACTVQLGYFCNNWLGNHNIRLLLWLNCYLMLQNSPLFSNVPLDHYHDLLLPLLLVILYSYIYYID